MRKCNTLQVTRHSELSDVVRDLPIGRHMRLRLLGFALSLAIFCSIAVFRFTSVVVDGACSDLSRVDLSSGSDGPCSASVKWWRAFVGVREPLFCFRGDIIDASQLFRTPSAVFTEAHLRLIGLAGLSVSLSVTERLVGQLACAHFPNKNLSGTLKRTRVASCRRKTPGVGGLFVHLHMPCFLLTYRSPWLLAYRLGFY